MARDHDITDIFLLPGEYFVGGAGHRIRTLLGSCVSITLWHPVRKIGTMSHFLLSSRSPGKAKDLNSRYGEEALALMLSELRAMGVDPKECQAKIFGGGQMFPGTSQGIGRQNGEVALRLLRAHGIPVVSESLYGMGHRSIIFDVDSGHVWSRHMEPGQLAEAQAAVHGARKPVDGAADGAARRACRHAVLTQAARVVGVEALGQAAAQDIAMVSGARKAMGAFGSALLFLSLA